MDRFQPRLSLSLQFPGGELVTAALRLFKDAAWHRAADEWRLRLCANDSNVTSLHGASAGLRCSLMLLGDVFLTDPTIDFNHDCGSDGIGVRCTTTASETEEGIKKKNSL